MRVNLARVKTTYTRIDSRERENNCEDLITIIIPVCHHTHRIGQTPKTCVPDTARVVCRYHQ